MAHSVDSSSATSGSAIADAKLHIITQSIYSTPVKYTTDLRSQYSSPVKYSDVKSCTTETKCHVSPYKADDGYFYKPYSPPIQSKEYKSLKFQSTSLISKLFKHNVAPQQYLKYPLEINKYTCKSFSSSSSSSTTSSDFLLFHDGLFPAAKPA